MPRQPLAFLPFSAWGEELFSGPEANARAAHAQEPDGGDVPPGGSGLDGEEPVGAGAALTIGPLIQAGHDPLR